MIGPSVGRQQQRWYRNQWMIIGAALIVAALFLVGYVAWLFQPVDRGSAAVQYVRVKPGQTASEVADTLFRRGVIRSTWAFDMLSRFNGVATDLSAGVYRLSGRQSLGSIMYAMKSGDVVVTRVTIPEGFTVKQIAARLVAAHIGTAKEYQVLETRSLPGMPPSSSRVRDPLEGYLFPATYFFSYGTTARQAFLEMWNTFRTRMVKGVYDKAHTSLTLVQWVTLASIIQEEAKDPSQMSRVAAVFLNRYHQNMPFQSDATVKYALGGLPPGGLVAADLSNPSPYNTYMHKGFPPGPITNPGAATLQAALTPSPVPYLYFVSLRSGRILFATTFQQQLANIQFAKTHPKA